MNYNYRYLRSRLKIKKVEKLPPGRWLTVKAAAIQCHRSMMTIRYRYLNGCYKAIKHKGRILIHI